MSKGTYYSLNLTADQQALLKILETNEIDIFSLDELLTHDELDHINLKEAIENLVTKEFLHRIERGKYCRHTFRNEYVISNYLVDDGVVAYWSALNLHGLTEQFPNTVFVQTTKQKKHKTIFGVQYRFIKIQSEKMMGIITQGYGNHQFRMTNVEKTLVDCFHLPKYSGGYPELLHALNKAKISSVKLTEAAKAVNNIAVIKRLGFFIELLEKENMATFIKFARGKVNEKYNLLDPREENTGQFNSRWRLRINVPEEDILLMSEKTS